VRSGTRSRTECDFHFRLDSLPLPPPDLVVEIDVSRTRLDKSALYASLGVPELWRYDGNELAAYALDADDYREVSYSRALSWLPIAEVARFLKLRSDHTQTELLRLWQAWVREHV